MSSKQYSTKEMFLQYVDPENNPPQKRDLTEEEKEQKRLKDELDERCLEVRDHLSNILHFFT